MPTSLGDNSPQPVECSGETVVVESGRTQLDRQSSYVVQSRADERTNRRQRLGAHLRLEFLQTEPDRRQRLACLIVQLACEAFPLRLLPFEQPSHGLTPYALGQLHRDGGAIRERLREPHVRIGEPMVGSRLVVGGDDPNGAAVNAQWDVQRGRGIEQAGCGLVDLWVIDQRIDPLGPVAAKRPPCFRALHVELQAEQRIRVLSACCLDHEALPIDRGQLDQNGPRRDELAKPVGGEAKQLRDVGLGHEEL